MRVTLLTSNQPRHIAFVEALADIADVVYVVQECSTVFPGQVDDFFRKSAVMQEYFGHVLRAESEVFGGPRFAPANVTQLPIRMGDLSRLDREALGPAVDADVFVVFGASYIRGWLCDFLVERRAYNIHMGVSPYYRGSSTNFWALYDRRPEYVGATVHLLSKGLDSGPMLFHVLPAGEEHEPFTLGMRAVEAAQSAFAEALRCGRLQELKPIPQNRDLEMRYTRNADFTDEVAREYLSRLAAPEQIGRALRCRDLRRFARPVIGVPASMTCVQPA